jgi:K+-sensing histidine kinase KdpD
VDIIGAGRAPRRIIRWRHRGVAGRHALAHRPEHPARLRGPREAPRPIALSDPETLGVVAHELRTPITTIFAGSKLLQEGRLSRRTRGEVVDALAAEAERLSDFVEDLIALAGSEGPSGFEIEPVLVQRILPAVLAAEAIRTPGTRYRSFVPRDLPPLIADDGAVRRLVRSIIASATDLGGGAGIVEVVARSVRGAIRMRALARHAHVDDERLAILFEPLAAGSAADRRPGAQFGLAAAQATAVALGGRAWVRRTRNGIELGVEIPVGDEGRDRLQA